MLLTGTVPVFPVAAQPRTAEGEPTGDSPRSLTRTDRTRTVTLRRSQNKWGVIDPSGNWLLPPRYKRVRRIPMVATDDSSRIFLSLQEGSRSSVVSVDGSTVETFSSPLPRPVALVNVLDQTVVVRSGAFAIRPDSGPRYNEGTSRVQTTVRMLTRLLYSSGTIVTVNLTEFSPSRQSLLEGLLGGSGSGGVRAVWEVRLTSPKSNQPPTGEPVWVVYADGRVRPANQDALALEPGRNSTRDSTR